MKEVIRSGSKGCTKCENNPIMKHLKGWLKNQAPYQINESTGMKPIKSKRKLALIQITLLDYSQDAAHQL